MDKYSIGVSIGIFIGVDENLYDETPILPCLRVINLDHNPITSIERNFFFGLRESNLQEITFQKCNLKHINTCKFMDIVQYLLRMIFNQMLLNTCIPSGTLIFLEIMRFLVNCVLNLTNK